MFSLKNRLFGAKTYGFDPSQNRKAENISNRTLIKEKTVTKVFVLGTIDKKMYYNNYE